MISLPSSEGTHTCTVSSETDFFENDACTRARWFVRGAPHGGGKCFDLRRKLGGENLCVSLVVCGQSLTRYHLTCPI